MRRELLVCVLLLLSLMVILPVEVKAAATIYSTQSGWWQNTTTWLGGAVPGTTDTVYICNGHTVTVDDNRTVYKIDINTTATLQVGDTTPAWNVTLTFDDTAGAGFDVTSAGTLVVKGTSTYYGMNITGAGAPPTNYWNFKVDTGDMSVTADFALFRYSNQVSTDGTLDIENSTFDYSTSGDYAVWFRSGTTITNFNNVTFTNMARAMQHSKAHTEFYNIHITASTYCMNVGTTAEFRYSNFDTTKIADHANRKIVSKSHNDVATDYKISVGGSVTLSKSAVTYDFTTGDNIELVSGKFIMDEDGEALAITRVAGTTWQVGKDTPDASVTLTFDDAQNAGNPPGFTDGWSHVHGGSLITTGTVAYPMTITSAATPPTYSWDGPWYEQSTGEISLRNTTIEYSIAFGLGESITNIISNTTWYYSSASGSFAVIVVRPISGNVYRDINVSTFQGAGSQVAFLVWPSTDYAIMNNVTVYANSGSNDVGVDEASAGKIAEFLDSTFDLTKIRTWAGNPNAWVSQNHNDSANSYKLGSRAGSNFSKSYINNDFGASDTVEIRTGTLTMDEDGDATSVFVLSSTELEIGTGHTLDLSTNLTVNGTLESQGTITDSGDYFDFWIGGGSVWLNNSTVSSAKLGYYLGGFNFTVGNSANSTINEWTLEAPSGQDTAFNVTFYDFSRKASGVIWHMNVTAASGTVNMCTTNLTAGETYRSYVDSVQNTEGTASGDAYNFTVSMSTHHVNLTWVSGAPPPPPPPGTWVDILPIIVQIRYEYNVLSEVRVRLEINESYPVMQYFVWRTEDGREWITFTPYLNFSEEWEMRSDTPLYVTVRNIEGVPAELSTTVKMDHSWFFILLLLIIVTVLVAYLFASNYKVIIRKGKGFLNKEVKW